MQKLIAAKQLDDLSKDIFQIVEEQDKIIQALKRCVLRPMEQDLEGMKAMQRMMRERRLRK